MSEDGKQPTRTACDRCHGMKEKCVYSLITFDQSPACSRCAKLARPCITSRRKRTIGRPRKADTTLVLPRACREFVWCTRTPSSPPPKLSQADPASWPSNPVLAHRSSAELSLLQALFDKNRPTNFIDRFVLGPSFAEAELRGICGMLVTFPEAAESLLSGLLACSRRFFVLVEGTAGGNREPGRAGEEYRYSAKAAKELRERGERNEKRRGGVMDLLPPLVIALGIMTFDLLDSGLHAHSICRYALGLVSSSSASSLETERSVGLESQMLPLIHMDTCNCLVRRQIPLHQLQSTQKVDRYIGLCGSLFSLLYDVCHVSRKLSLGGADRQEYYDELGRVETAVRHWRPEISEEDAARLTPREIDGITTQASVHQKAVLLFIHRLRFGFGDEDDVATHMAASVLDDIERLCCPREGEEPLPFEHRLSLPFLVAAAELQDKVQRVQALGLLDWIMWKRMYHKVAGLLERLILHVWEARDHGWRGHWADLTENGPPFVLF
jgi:hypothetical protein